jgi:hypothetical protein
MSLELAFQRSSIWLPRWALRTSISRAAYRAGVSRIMKTVRYVENLTRPRIPFLTGEVSDTITGLVCVILALIMALPIVPRHEACPAPLAARAAPQAMADQVVAASADLHTAEPEAAEVPHPFAVLKNLKITPRS